MTEERAAQLVRMVAHDVPVGPAPVGEVVRRGRRRARAKTLVMAGVAVVSAAVVIVGSVVVGGRTTPEPAGVVRVANPLPLPWWGDGTLHLADVTVPAPGLTDLVVIGDAVAYGTEDGDVVVVQGDGRRSTVGHKSAEAPLAAGAPEGWLAWVDPGDHAPQLVVHDVRAGSDLGRLDLTYRGARWERLDAGSHPIAVDAGRVYYAGQDGDWSWAPGEAQPVRESPADVDLLDVRDGHRVAHAWSRDSGWAETLRVTRPEFDMITLYPGGDGWFSPDAGHLAVRSETSLLVFRDGSHEPVPLDLAAGLPGYDVGLVFADPETVVVMTGGTVLPAPTQTPRNGPFGIGPRYDTWDLSTCDLDTGACTTLEDATTDAPPILPG